MAAFHDFLGLFLGFFCGATGTITFIHIADNQNDEDNNEEERRRSDEQGCACVFVDDLFAFPDFSDSGIKDFLVESYQ